MVSTRTKYRKKRIMLICSSITLLAQILLIRKRILEQVHLKYFKGVKKTVDKLYEEVNKQESVSHA